MVIYQYGIYFALLLVKDANCNALHDFAIAIHEAHYMTCMKLLCDRYTCLRQLHLCNQV